jgi:Flp pilus assembly protein TadD
LTFRYGLAQGFYGNGEEGEAMALYQDILSRHPREVNAYLGMANLQIKAGDDSGATATYERLLQVAPGNAQAYEALANLSSQQGDYQQALT